MKVRNISIAGRLNLTAGQSIGISQIQPCVLVAAAFVTLGIAFGCVYSLGAMAVLLETEMGLTRDHIGIIMGLALGGIYLGAPLSGYLADRIGARMVSVAGMAVLTLSLFTGAQAAAPWQAILALGCGVGCAMGLIYSTTMSAAQTWFTAKRGLATGIIACGMGAGTLMIVPLSQEVAAIEGWRQAVSVMSLLCAAAAVLASPWISWHPDFVRKNNRPAGKAAKPAGSGVRSLIGTRSFLLLGGSSAVIGFVLLTPMAHLAANAVDRGMSLSDAAQLVAIAGVASIPARIAAGVLGDRIGRTKALAWSYLGLGVSFAVWFAAQDPAMMSVFAVLYGGFYGASVVLRPSATADHFSGPCLATMVGLTYLASFAGAVAGPLAYGVVREMVGVYEPALLASIPVCLAAALLVWRLDGETVRAARRRQIARGRAAAS